MREFLFQEREVGGDFHSGSEVSPEGAGLQGGEEGVEFGKVRALLGSLLFNGSDDGGEAKLEFHRGKIDLKFLQTPKAYAATRLTSHKSEGH